MSFCFVNAIGQTTFQRVYGKIFFDWGNEVIETKDGDYVIAGTTESYGAREAYIMKLDCQGNIVWNRILNETPGMQSHGMTVIETYDGSYVVTGETQTYASSKSDAFLWKVAPNGVTQWLKSYGTGELELTYDVVQMDDSGYVAVGSERLDGSGNLNVFLFRTDNAGNLLWSKSFGGVAQEVGYSLVKRPGGDVLVAGYTSSFGVASSNLLLWKVAPNGVTLFSRAYGSASFSSGAYDIYNTLDGGYVIGGWANPFPGNMNYYVMKFDANDNVQWAKSYEQQTNSQNEGINGIIQTNDKGFALAGYNASGNINGQDESLIKLDSAGNSEWGWVYGGSNVDWMQSVIQTPDSGYLSVGYSFALGQSSIGGGNIFLVKTKGDGSSGCNEQSFIVKDTALNPQVFSGGTSTNYGSQFNPTPSFQNNKFPIDTLCESLAPFLLPVSITADSIICEGDSVVLSVATAGNSFLWNTGETTQSITVSPSATTGYSVSVSYSPCYSPSNAVITVTVNSIPTLTVSTSDTAICSGDSLVLTAAGTGAAYLWSNGNTTSSFIVFPTSTTIFSVSSLNGSCTAKDSVSVTVFPSPVVTISGDSSLCPGDSTMLTGAGGTEYTWNTGSSSSAISINPTASTIYSLTASIGSCIDSTDLMVIVNDPPIVDAGNDTTLSIGDGVWLAPTGGTTYQWSPAGGLSCDTCAYPYANPAKTTVYYVTVTDANGCTAVDSVKITIADCGDIFVPNVFSPNGDGSNDFFEVFANEACFRSFKLSVFNRWGQLVFEASDPTQKWDGNSKGRECNTGVFIYHLSYVNTQNQDFLKTGNVTLLR